MPYLGLQKKMAGQTQALQILTRSSIFPPLFLDNVYRTTKGNPTLEKILMHQYFIGLIVVFVALFL